jgi:hypothetical protein
VSPSFSTGYSLLAQAIYGIQYRDEDFISDVAAMGNEDVILKHIDVIRGSCLALT